MRARRRLFWMTALGCLALFCVLQITPIGWVPLAFLSLDKGAGRVCYAHFCRRPATRQVSYGVARSVEKAVRYCPEHAGGAPSTTLQNDLPLGALAAPLAAGLWIYAVVLAAMGRFVDPTHLFRRQHETRHPSDALLVFLAVTAVVASFGPAMDFVMRW